MIPVQSHNSFPDQILVLKTCMISQEQRVFANDVHENWPGKVKPHTYQENDLAPAIGSLQVYRKRKKEENSMDRNFVTTTLQTQWHFFCVILYVKLLHQQGMNLSVENERQKKRSCPLSQNSFSSCCFTARYDSDTNSFNWTQHLNDNCICPSCQSLTEFTQRLHLFHQTIKGDGVTGP